MLNEANIIAYLKNEFPAQIGDDAAVIPYSAAQSYVISKDLLVEDVHFNLKYFDVASLAHKALHVNLSDLAAMGARPKFILLGLAIAPSYAPQLQHFLTAFTKYCKDMQILLIGGDTTSASQKLFISVTIIGIADNDKIKYRQNACANDLIYLAGNLGFAHLGLQALETANNKETSVFKPYCLTPTARLREGLWLAQQPGVHAMMDCSDGLFIDLQRLCAASHVAGVINLDGLPNIADFTAACQTLHLDPLNTQLTGGEDYGLIITIDPTQAAHIGSAFNKMFGYSLTPIGCIKSGHNISFLKNDCAKSLTLKPFSHFGEFKDINKNNIE